MELRWERREVTDSFFAGINLIMPVLNILGTTGYMFGVGGSALIAKTLGEKEQEKADRLFSLIILASFSLGVLMLVPGFMAALQRRYHY
ncbi:MAG: hypothetical protein IJI23_10895 [Lachnospiraceae bacterium]|nr:hypothetical protein [Lachnospiraceae bacterium]